MIARKKTHLKQLLLVSSASENRWHRLFFPLPAPACAFTDRPVTPRCRICSCSEHRSAADRRRISCSCWSDAALAYAGGAGGGSRQDAPPVSQRPADRPTAFSYSFPATRQLGYGATARCEFEHGRTSDRMGLWIEQCDKCVTSTARSSVVNDTCVVDLGHYLTAVWPVTSALHSIATRSSAIAEEPRDALWQLKPC